MEDLSLHILDIAENSIRAGATRVSITIIEDVRKNLFTIEIKDNGRGMDETELSQVRDPFFTTKSCRNVGLGIPLLAQAARECNGSFCIDSAKGRGSSLIATFQHDHIDRKPLGDMGETMIVLIASSPDTDFLLEHRRNDKLYTLDTADVKQQLGGIPINSPEVIKIIKDDIRRWLNEVNFMIQ